MPNVSTRRCAAIRSGTPVSKGHVNSRVTMTRTRIIENNGLRMRIADVGEAGDLLVILAHGWPESWYSWRHQIGVLGGAGFQVIAPDMRGYGDTDAPCDIRAYDIVHLAADMVGIIDEAGADQAVIIGHD